jgi:predicted extracellular nuclease
VNKRLLSLAAAAALSTAAMPASAAIIINEVYSGGGSSQAIAAYKTDYIELYNTDLVNPVDLSGYTLAYGSSAQAAGTFNSAVGTLASGSSIAAGGYFLVQTGGSGTGGANDVTPDADFGSTGLAATSGALRLQDAAAVTLDIVGWGTTNNFETAPETTPANIGISIQRIPNGVDTGDNATDFQQGTPTPDAFNAVPEPGAVAFLGIASLAVLRRRHTK